MADGFDGWQRDYEMLEKEENPFAIIGRLAKIMFRIWWKIFKFVMIKIKEIVLWIMRRDSAQRQKQSGQPMLYPAQ